MTDLSPEALAERETTRECMKTYKPVAPYSALRHLGCIWACHGEWPNILEKVGEDDILAFGLAYNTHCVNYPEASNRAQKCRERLEYLGIERFLDEGLKELGTD